MFHLRVLLFLCSFPTLCRVGITRLLLLMISHSHISFQSAPFARIRQSLFLWFSSTFSPLYMHTHLFFLHIMVFIAPHFVPTGCLFTPLKFVFISFTSPSTQKYNSTNPGFSIYTYT